MSEKLNSGNVYGAYVRVWIRYEGTLEQLACKLATALNLKSIDVEAKENPPHAKVGMAEAFGWVVWLEEDSEHPPYKFALCMKTEDSITELFEGRMHDLSPWFARFLITACDIEAVPAD